MDVANGKVISALEKSLLDPRVLETAMQRATKRLTRRSDARCRDARPGGPSPVASRRPEDHRARQRARSKGCVGRPSRTSRRCPRAAARRSSKGTRTAEAVDRRSIEDGAESRRVLPLHRRRNSVADSLGNHAARTTKYGVPNGNREQLHIGFHWDCGLRWATSKGSGALNTVTAATFSGPAKGAESGNGHEGPQAYPSSDSTGATGTPAANPRTAPC
jgi:hypothetical protein